MWPFKSASRRRAALFAHDGTHWHCLVLDWRRGEWQVVDRTQTPGKNVAQLPRTLLTHAAEHGARQLRLLLPADIHAMKFEEPPDAEPEETHTALAYEAASELGQEAHLLRIAWTAADNCHLGADPDDVLVSGFDLENIARYERDCQFHDLAFSGVAPLELAALALMRKRNTGDCRLVYLRETSGFYASPSLAVAPMAVGALPIGWVPDIDPARDEERVQRTLRRLRSHGSLPVAVTSLGEIDDAGRQRVRQAIGDTPDVSWSTLAEDLPALADVALQARPNDASRPCPLAGSPRPPRDPHRAGTVLFWLLILGAAAYVGVRIHALDEQAIRLGERKEKWQKVVQAREAEESKGDAFLTQRNALLATQELLDAARPIDKATVPILEAMAEAMPPYTCLASVTTTEDGSYEIRGLTLWQEGLPALEEALSQALAPFKRRARPGKISLQEERNEQEFVFIVSAEVRP